MRYVQTPYFLKLVFLLLLGLVPAVSGFAESEKHNNRDKKELSNRESKELGNQLWEGRPTIFQKCPESKGQSDMFALCATATCRTLDQVAYCKCDVMNKESISLPFQYRENGETKNVCDLLLAGNGNGFTVSTYATPPQLEKDYDPAKERLGLPLAIYTCAGDSDSSSGYSAQCDGGLCFTSTRGQEFPGFGRLREDEIICSCPPVTNQQAGFQVSGPWLCEPGDRNLDGRCCDENYQNRICGVDSITRTGTEIAVGAVTGTPAILSKELDGKLPEVNRCVFRESGQK